MRKMILLTISILVLSACKKHPVEGVCTAKDYEKEMVIFMPVSTGKITVVIPQKIREKWVLIVRDSTNHRIQVSEECWRTTEIGDSVIRKAEKVTVLKLCQNPN